MVNEREKKAAISGKNHDRERRKKKLVRHATNISTLHRMTATSPYVITHDVYLFAPRLYYSISSDLSLDLFQKRFQRLDESGKAEILASVAAIRVFD